MKRLLLIPFLFLASCYNVGYRVETERFESLTGDFQSEKVKIYSNNRYDISISKVTSGLSYYSIDIDYRGSNWLFIDGLVMIKADDLLMKKIDENPSRVVVYKGVHESISVIVEKEELATMANAKDLRIQFFADPITISEEGRNNISRFILDMIR